MKFIKAAFLCFLVFALSVNQAGAQDVKVIHLKQEHITYSPKSYYIRQVTDSIPDSLGIGVLNDGVKRQVLAFEEGTAMALNGFITANVAQDITTTPMNLCIKKLDVTATKKGAKWSIKISSNFVFSTERMNLELTSGDLGETTSDPAIYIEGHIRKLIENKLEQFEKWWAQNKDRFATASSVKVNVTLAKTSDKKNLIVYNAKRPLKQEDFQGTVQKEVAEKAMTMSGNFFASMTEVKAGQTVLNVVITPYFDKSESWFNGDNTNPQLLPHEQAHFDITAIKTCELVEALRKATFTNDTYQSQFEQLCKQYLEETNAEQDAYDAETQHGTIPTKQQEWQDKIGKRVREVGCY